MLHTYDERLARLACEAAPEHYYTLLCCGQEISETDFLDNQGIEYYQSRKGDLWCADCLRSGFDISSGLKYIRKKDLQEDFKEYLTAENIFRLIDTYCNAENHKQFVENILKAFCFDDFDSYAEWFINEYKE